MFTLVKTLLAATTLAADSRRRDAAGYGHGCNTGAEAPALLGASRRRSRGVSTGGSHPSARQAHRGAPRRRMRGARRQEVRKVVLGGWVRASCIPQQTASPSASTAHVYPAPAAIATYATLVGTVEVAGHCSDPLPWFV